MKTEKEKWDEVMGAAMGQVVSEMPFPTARGHVRICSNAFDVIQFDKSPAGWQRVAHQPAKFRWP